jgi:hypothetical protein
VAVLSERLKDGDAAVRSAAAAALGAIGSEAAAGALAAALAGGGGGVPALGEACLVGAERLAAAHPDAAVKLYEQVIASAAPKPVRLAAMLGRVRVRPEAAAAWIGEQLAQQDAGSFRAAMTAAREIDRDDVTAALVKALPTLAAERQALVLRALVGRKAALPVDWLVEQTKRDEAAVREAAVDALASSEGKEAATRLVEVALGGGSAAALALERLKTASGEEIDLALIARTADVEKAKNVALVDLAGSRRIKQLKPLVIELTNSRELPLRQAAVIALGQLADLADLDELLPLAKLGDPHSPGTQAARSALRTAALRLDDREACAARLAKEIDGAHPEVQGYLLHLLREIGGGCHAALNAVTAAANSQDASLKEIGTRELGAWPTPAAGDALLALATSDAQEKYRIRALRGYIRIGRQLQLSDADRLKYFHAAMETAQRDEERRLALGILDRAPSAESLKLATESLDKPELASAAGEAAVKISGKLIATDPAAVAAALGKVKSTKGVELSPKLAPVADALLRRAGGAK